MRKKIVVVLTSMALIFMIAWPVMAADTIKIAYIDALSGSMGSVGTTSFKHFQYMAELINAQGGVLGGKHLEIVPFDNKVSPQDSIIQLKNAVDQGIHIITQGNGSSVAAALIGAVNKHNERNPGDELIFLNFAAITPAFTNEECSFWHFRFDSHVDMKVAAITDYIKDTPQIKKVYLINQDYVFGHSVSDSARRQLKAKRPDIKIVGDSFTPLGKVKDFSPYIAEIKAANADAVITGNWGPDMSLLVKASKDAGLKIPYFTFYGGGLGSPKAIGKDGIGIVNQVSEWHSNLSHEEKNKADEKFYLDYQAKYSNGGDDPFYYGRIRTLMEMLKAAIDKAGRADAKSIAFALEGMEIQTPYGKATMRAEDHQLLQPLYLSVYAPAGTAQVKYDTENTGVGFHTIKRIEAAATALPTTCKMERPEK